MRKNEKRNYTKKTSKELGIYLERHHVFPKSIFGNNDRIVYLTAREHYIAHALLERIYISRYGIFNNKSMKMIYAHTAMKKENCYVNSYLYEKARQRRSSLMKGKRVYEMTEETRKRMSISRKKRIHTEKSNILRSQSCERNKYKIISPTGEIFIITNMRKYCRENLLDCSSMIKVSKGKLKSYKKYKVEFIEKIK